MKHTIFQLVIIFQINKPLNHFQGHPWGLSSNLVQLLFYHDGSNSLFIKGKQERLEMKENNTDMLHCFRLKLSKVLKTPENVLFELICNVSHRSKTN